VEQSLPSDPLDIGLLSASADSFKGPPPMESNILSVLLNHVMICPVNTISYIPRTVHPLLAHVFNVELRKACSLVWGFVRLLIFAKAVLRAPCQSYHRCCFIIGSTLLDHTHVWSQLNLFGLLYRMISKVLSLLNPLVKIFINHVLYTGLMKVGTAMPFKHLIPLVLQDLMMMMHSKICLSITPFSMS